MERFSKNKTFWILLFVSTIFTFLRIPSLIEPHWYGDEGIYQVVGRALLSGKILYQEIWDNKPPFLYIIYAITVGDLYAVKLLSLISGVLSVLAFYLLSTKLFVKNTTRYFAVFTYAILFGTPLLEGNIANAENFMMLPVILAGYYILYYRQSRKVGQLVVSGLLLSIVISTKIVGIFDFLAFTTFLLIADYSEKIKFKFKPYFLYLVALTPPFIIFSIYFFVNGAFIDFVNAVFIQNVSYVGEENSFLIPMGTLVFKTILLTLFILLLTFLSKKITKVTLFIYLWVGFGIYNALFSDRPYTHYLLVLLPAFCLLVGHFLEHQKNKVTFLLILIILFFAYFHFKVYKKTISYYYNFVTFVTNKTDIISYERFFDSNTPRDYTIANFINSNASSNDEVFLWSDSAQIYALSNKLPISKYIVAYHIKFYKNADIITREKIEQAKPKYIIQTAEGNIENDILSSYELRYIMEGVRIYERQT